MGDKIIHVSVAVKGEESKTSFYFGGATVGQLAHLNAELDVLKEEIINRIREAPKEFEVEDWDDEEVGG